MIYDCFTFFNELELLEIRLNIMDPYVDKFVLVESTKTHQGQPKPLYFQEHQSVFSKFRDKIIPVVVEDMPAYNGSNSWELEHFQRNAIGRALKACSHQDKIILSDVDEIPNLSAIDLSNIDKNTLYIFRQYMFYYYINCMNDTNDKNYRWHGSVLFHYSEKISPQTIRDFSLQTMGLYHHKWLHRLYWNIRKHITWQQFPLHLKFVENGGWHFSYLGGVDRIIQKLSAFAHTEYNTEEYKNPERIKQALEKGEDIFGRDFHYTFIPLNDIFPSYIIENQEKFQHLIKQ